MRQSFLVISSFLSLTLAAVTAQNVIVNGGFETPTTSGFQAYTAVQGWNTTATDGKMEIWADGYSGVNTANGTGLTNGQTQFTELQANEYATMFQDVTITTAGGVDYSFLHRGRLTNGSGVDVMRLTITYAGANGTFGNADDLIVVTRTASDNSVNEAGEFNGWKQYAVDDAFTSVANGKYRVAFTAVSSAGDIPQAGNFLDTVSVGSAVVPEPSTVILLGLGATLVGWKFSKKARSARFVA